MPATEQLLPKPILTSSSGAALDASLLADDNAATSITLQKAGATTNPWLQAEFPHPVTIRSVTASIGRNNRGANLTVSLQSSDDGTNFHSILPITMGGAPEQTLSLAPIAAKYFRLQFALQTPNADDITVNEFVLRLREITS